MEKLLLFNAQETIFARKDLPVRVRNSAWLLYQHETAKTPGCDELVLAAVLLWMDEQRLHEARRRLEPTQSERQLLLLLVRDGLTLKEISLRTGKKFGTTKQHFKRMRHRMGVVTLYQLVALSVERGWVRLEKE